MKQILKAFIREDALRPLRERLDDFMRNSFKVMHDELHTVKVRISPCWARWVGEKIWHESQKLVKLSDGSLEMTFRVAGLDEIKRWILSFGPEAEVIEPRSFRETVQNELLATLHYYQQERIAIRSKAKIFNKARFSD
jgi:predicted DNA-binding transcriptional regulator YafY